MRPPAASGHILVVDDDRAFRVSTSALLRQDGYEVTAVGDGQEAVAALRQQRFDLMLLDLRLPGMDGLRIVEALTAPEHVETPPPPHELHRGSADSDQRLE